MNKSRRNTEESVIELQLLGSLDFGKKLRFIPKFDDVAKKFNAIKKLDFGHGFSYLPHIHKVVNGLTEEGANVIRQEFGNGKDPIHGISRGPQIYDVNLTEQHRQPYEEIREEGLVPIIGGYTNTEGRPQLEVGTSEAISDEEAIKRMGTEQEGSFRFDPHSGPGAFFPNPNKTHIKAGQQVLSMGIGHDNAARGATDEEQKIIDEKKKGQKLLRKLDQGKYSQLRARLTKIAGYDDTCPNCGSKNVHKDEIGQRFCKNCGLSPNSKGDESKSMARHAGTEMSFGGPENNKEDTDLANKEKKRREDNPEAAEPTILQKDDLNQKQGQIHSLGPRVEPQKHAGTKPMENGPACPECTGKGKDYRANCPTCEGNWKTKVSIFKVIKMPIKYDGKDYEFADLVEHIKKTKPDIKSPGGYVKSIETNEHLGQLRARLAKIGESDQGYKKCESCGAKNSLSESECQNCGSEDFVPVKK